MIDVMRSEWTKFRSVRSTMWSMATVVVVMVGFSILNSKISLDMIDKEPLGDPAALSMAGAQFATLVVAALGVLVISGEYRTGMIRTSLLAVPRRGRMLAAKVIVFTLAVLALMLVTTLVSFFAGQLVLGEHGVALTEGDSLRIVLGSALYITATGLFGLAVGTVIRHTAGGIVAITVLLLILPQLATVLPGEAGAQVMKYITSTAGMRIMSPASDALLPPWTGFGVYLLWVAAAMALALTLLRRRDA
ncbi:ABC transporter permease [Spongiactinospora gelatinilytica]|uniref:ABC transporter permease n=1 Tax=Spongiactinospora gelatinilytica TaxID=2666298 RepID=A0A2W2GAT2_9ACTN|nr:ABC transporter permease subunit [Spongiactinospora gelatinilytica]PZG37395.1 ABC transporter permease [Spongiactinospora gelatinilytica]